MWGALKSELIWRNEIPCWICPWTSLSVKKRNYKLCSCWIHRFGSLRQKSLKKRIEKKQLQCLSNSQNTRPTEKSLNHETTLQSFWSLNPGPYKVPALGSWYGFPTLAPLIFLVMPPILISHQRPDSIWVGGQDPPSLAPMLPMHACSVMSNSLRPHGL